MNSAQTYVYTAKTEVVSVIDNRIRLLLLLMMFLMWTGLNATPFSELPGDTDETAQQQFDINDPRNPDCPCHEWQKQADEEYQRMQQQRAQSEPVKETVNAENKTKSTTDNNTVSNTSSRDNSGSVNRNRPNSRNIKKNLRRNTKRLLHKVIPGRNGTLKYGKSRVNCFHF